MTSNMNYTTKDLSCVNSLIPGKCLKSTSYYATNISFHILANSLIILLNDAVCYDPLTT
jgi:hypothetical protein